MATIPSNKKTETARHFAHLMLELRDHLRQFIQGKFRESNIDLTYEMHQVMACLWKKDGINQQELADKTLKDKASMTYLIDNLTKRNMVKRKQDPKDRRSKLIYLTPKGKLLGKRTEIWVLELFSVAGKNLDIGEIRDGIRLVEKMRDNIKAVDF